MPCFPLKSLHSRKYEFVFDGFIRQIVSPRLHISFFLNVELSYEKLPSANGSSHIGFFSDAELSYEKLPSVNGSLHIGFFSDVELLSPRNETMAVGLPFDTPFCPSECRQKKQIKKKIRKTFRKKCRSIKQKHYKIVLLYERRIKEENNWTN